MNKTAFIFPGQGSQFSGMGKDFAEKIEELAGKNVAKLCTDATDEELKQTVNSQPAILAVSIALYELLRNRLQITPDYTAGHSLGEYSALYAAGVSGLDEIIKLVSKRAELMSNAPEGSMTAILGLNEDKIAEVIEQCSPEGIICAANYNTQVQTVISGETKAIKKANELAKEMGAKRVVPLAVSGAFHSPLMRPVSEEFAGYVNSANLNDAQIPVVTNVDALATADKADFSTKMVKQVCSPVYWKQSVEYMTGQGVDTFIEIGPGKVLSGMIKKIAPGVKVCNVCDKETLEAAVEKEIDKCLM